MGQVERHLIECGELARDTTKCAKSRRVARTSIEICHGVIDLKEENKRLRNQLEDLRIEYLKLAP